MTSVTGLLSRLRGRNVTVQVAGEQLRLNGPPGALGPDLLAELKSRKEELIEFLRSVQDREDYAPIPVVESRPDYELSHAQKRLWVLEQFDDGHVAYNIPAAFRLRGPLDLVAFEAALAAIVRRHESLRTGFAVVDGRPVQVVQDRVHFGATLVDLSHMDDREALAERYAEQEAETPFDLSAPPLLRVKVLQFGPEEHVVVFNMHHIISDGWSIAVMLRELRSLYRTYRADNGRSRAPLRVQYKDYAAWQRQFLCQADAGREGDYWHEKLSGDLPALQLPADRPRPPVKTYSGDTLEFALDADATAMLRNLCRQEQVTLFMILVALVKIILHRYSGQRDIIVGSPIAGRNHPDLEGQIGFYVNMLALRDVVDPGASFSALLQQVKRTATEAYQHQNYPFDRLVDELSVSRDVGRSAIFDVTVALQNAPESELSLDGIEVEPLGNLYKKSKFDLTFSFTEVGDALHGRLEYNTDLYDRDRIVRLWDHFAQLVTSVGSALQAGAIGQRPAGELDLLTEQETSRLLGAFNDTGADYPEQATIVTLFEEQAAATPERVAVVCEGRELTYAELNERANSIAWYLREQHGVRPGDLVAVLLEPGERMIAALLGVLKSGAAYVPVDPAYPTDRIAYILDDCGARIVLTEDGPLSAHSYTHLQGLETASADVCVTPPRDPIRDVDALPIPDRSLVRYDKYADHIGQAMVKHSIALQATRGCPYRCAYCHRIMSRRHVRRSPEHLFDEVRLYRDMGVRRFAIIDDIFNLDRAASVRFFELLIENDIGVQLHFPNGLRGDLLTADYIDLMIRAGTTSLALALETASPRLQRLIGKNLDLGKLRESIQYLCDRYPHVILELFAMQGFPTETEAEALDTLAFIHETRWLHFPYLHLLKIYPNTDMERLALEHGVPRDAIVRSARLAFHEVPETLPFDKKFTVQCQSTFLNDYFLNKERLLHVLPHQMRALTEDELVQKYDSYLPVSLQCFRELLEFAGIRDDELPAADFLPEAAVAAAGLHDRMAAHFPHTEPAPEAFRVLLLDLSQNFTGDGGMLYDVVEPPLGLMNLLTYLDRHLGRAVRGRIAKARVDFDSYEQLRTLLADFRPDVIGIRTLTYYRDFFHRTVGAMRQWGIEAPIVAGGPYATSDYATLLQDRNVNLAVDGEGEATFRELVERMIAHGGRLPDQSRLREMAGIAFFDDVAATAGGHPTAARALPTVATADIGGMTAAGRGNPPRAARTGDTAYVIYTSGSTGRPKGCLVSHRNVVRLMRNDRFPFEFSDSDVWIMAHSYCFDFSVWEMYGALLYGGKVVVPKRSDVRDTERFLSLLKQHRVTVLNQTPGAFYNLLERELRQSEHTLARHLRYVIFGGSRLDPAHLRSWTDVYPLGDVRLVNMYGITETTVHVTFHGVTDEDVRSSSGRSPIGVPLPETTVQIFDAEGRLAPIGVTGEMYIGGSGVSQGYLGRPQLTAERFVPHRLGTGERLYRTGDLARWTPDGRLEFIGRADEQVKVRGYRIELGEIQHQLVAHPEVREALVMGRESATTGDGELVAYVVWTGDGEEGVRAELRSHLKQTLPDYMIPPYFVALNEFPLTRNGKIAVKELPAAEVRGTEAQAAPESEIEKILARVWQEVLHVTAVGVRDNFFELGGDSIKAVQIAARLRKEGLRLQLNDLFAEPMIADLAKRLEWTEDTAEQRTVTGVAPLTPIQRWFFEQDSAHRHHYNQAVMLFREAGFDADAVRVALAAITDHHDALRMVYVDETTGQADGAQGVRGPVPTQINRDGGGESFRLDVFDMTGETDVARAITETSTMLQGGMDLASGPLVRLGLFRTGDGDHLLIAVHHLVVDGVSWRILIDDFTEAYGRAERGEEICLPAKTDSFQFWASRLGGYANGTELLGELPFWEAIANAVTEPLPKDCVPPADSAKAHSFRHGSMGDTESVPVELTIEETDLLLRQAGRAYGTNVADLLLTALMLSLNDRFGVQTAVVNLEGHGREGILEGVDVSRTVGWFTSQFPVLLEARREGFAPPSDGELSYLIRSTKEALRRVPHKGIGYGLLRYMTSDENRAGARLDVQTELCFNYLGQFDRGDERGDFTVSEVGVGECISTEAENPYAITVNGFVLNDKLQLSFQFSRGEYDEDTIGLLAQAFESYLLSILEHCTTKRDCEPTPSDFGDRNLSLEDLDQITAMFESVEGNG